MTVRTAADVLDIQANTAALFYHKIRLVIEYYLALKAHEVFDRQVERQMTAILSHCKEEKRGNKQLEKWLYLSITPKNLAKVV